MDNSWRFVFKTLEPALDDFDEFIQYVVNRTSHATLNTPSGWIMTDFPKSFNKNKADYFLRSIMEKEEMFQKTLKPIFHVTYGSDTFYIEDVHDKKWIEAILEVGQFCDISNIHWAYTRVKKGFVTSYEETSLEGCDIKLSYQNKKYNIDWGF